MFKIICDLLVILRNIFQYSLGYGTHTSFYTRMTQDACQNGKPVATFLFVTPERPIRLVFRNQKFQFLTNAPGDFNTDVSWNSHLSPLAPINERFSSPFFRQGREGFSLPPCLSFCLSLSPSLLTLRLGTRKPYSD